MSSEDQEAQEDELLAPASIYDGDEFRKAVCPRGRNQDLFGFAIEFQDICDVILFAWMQFLKEETLVYLNIVSPFELKIDSQKKVQRRTAQASPNTELDFGGTSGSDTDQEEIVDETDVESLLNMIQEILDFDQAQQIKCFNSNLFLCNICFCKKLGSECMYFLECRHVYCKACLKDYFEIQIRDGQVQCLNCPEPKCPSVATPGQVKELVEAELFAHYDHVVYCSHPCCQLPVMQEPGCTMGICSSCNFVFCTLCRLTYHGVSPCKVTAEKLVDLRNEYLQAEEANKRLLEQRYGKRVIQKALEEMESKEWLEKNFKNCPCCGTPIEKLDGYNKMTCTGCMQYFCWICMSSLSRANLYKHFTDPASPCFNQLFDAVDVDEDIWEDEIED
uniref:RBR-type E3 ubiquitin transferase n=1 Tax=Nomascus leucogenys TaxID=61853 RepID=A0A2I3G372_NOMLE